MRRKSQAKAIAAAVNEVLEKSENSEAIEREMMRGSPETLLSQLLLNEGNDDLIDRVLSVAPNLGTEALISTLRKMCTSEVTIRITRPLSAGTERNMHHLRVRHLRAFDADGVCFGARTAISSTAQAVMPDTRHMIVEFAG